MEQTPRTAIVTAMDRAVVLARRSPEPDPNPRVGCVLLDGAGRVVGEGWHAGAGTAHAEVVALAAAGEDARGATAVVTLEPCAHTGRTGPCADALLAAGIRRVVYAVPDPGDRSGGGASRLAGAGVAVERLEHAGAQEAVAGWLARQLRPHVTWKIASTLDGRVAAADGSSRWITSPEARAAAHDLRRRVDAIVVGTGTALADDPALTAREADGSLSPHQPLRVVIGHRSPAVGSRLAGPGGELVHLATRDPAEALAALAARGVRTVLLEGGPTLGGAFWRAGLVDELLVHLAPALLGASGAPAVPELGIGTIADAARLDLLEVSHLGPDLQLRLRPHPSPPPPPCPTGRADTPPPHPTESAAGPPSCPTGRVDTPPHHRTVAGTPNAIPTTHPDQEV